eukprot:766681-Hanusia_phi.AAC.5
MMLRTSSHESPKQTRHQGKKYPQQVIHIIAMTYTMNKTTKKMQDTQNASSATRPRVGGLRQAFVCMARSKFFKHTGSRGRIGACRPAPPLPCPLARHRSGGGKDRCTARLVVLKFSTIKNF